MSRYGGFFQVHNLTKQTITSGTVTHYTSEYGDDTIYLSNLPSEGISGKKALYSSTSNRDYWKISVTLSNGTNISVTKECAFDNDNAGSTVVVQLIICNSANNGLNIAVPPSADRYENTSW